MPLLLCHGPHMSKPPAARTKTIHILLVDDNRHGSVARQTVLEEQGYSATAALNGEEALELFSKHHFDIVVTDFRMPKLNGLELIKQLRQKSDVPIILLSGYAEQLGLDEQSTGADAVIPKGANEVAHLLRAVTRLLNRGVPKKPVAAQRSVKPKARAKGV